MGTHPDGGSHLSVTENTRTNTTPSQKFGIATPESENTVTMRSIIEPGRTAEITPKGRAITRVTTILATPNWIVTGSLAPHRQLSRRLHPWLLPGVFAGVSAILIVAGIVTTSIEPELVRFADLPFGGH
jgi:hypothetical protein